MWYLLELNQGHMDFQSIALPPELRYLDVLSELGGSPRSEKRVQRYINFLYPANFSPFFCTDIKKKHYLCTR